MRFFAPRISAKLLLCAFAAHRARADETSPEPSSGGEDLDQRVRVLERRLEIQEEAATEEAKAAPTFTGGGREGFSWKSADGANLLKIRGYAHVDGRFFDADDRAPQPNTFAITRIRPIIEATAAKSFDFRLMADWSLGVASIQDAYIEYRLSPKLKLRTGKFKAPVGYERLMSATDIVFVNRAYPTNLVPNRDVGFQLSGDLAEGIVNYAAAIMNGVADGASGDVDVNDGKEASGRIFLNPFRNSMSPLVSGLGFGISGTSGANVGTPSATGLAPYRSPGQATIFAYRSDGQAAGTVVADGSRLRWSPQGHWSYARFGAYAEYVESKQDIRLASNRLEHESRAWQVTGTFYLTNDSYAQRGFAPKRPFGVDGGWGSLALDGRYEKLNVEGSAFPTFANPATSVSDAETWGAGLTWVLNRNVKLVADYQKTQFEGGAPTAAGGDREDENVVLCRTQFSF
jgi:phosphate-selective porin OprO/OprP